MKKLITLSLLMLLASCAIAQVTVPRYGITKNNDNTGRVLTYAFVTTIDVAQAAIDTVFFTPNAWETTWRPSALNDSCVVKLTSNTATYHVGDMFTIMLSKGSGNGRIRFGGSQFIISTTISTGIALAANKSMIMTLRWNGAKWIESYKMVQP